MVDFHAVIEKAVDGLSENSPELRAKVYDRARAAIKRQLDNISPPLSEAIKKKQLAKLEEAINDIEGQMELTVPDLEEDVFADLVSEEPDELFEEEVEPAPPPRRAPPRPARRRPEPATSPARRPRPSLDEPPYDEPPHDEPGYDEPRYDEPQYDEPQYDEPQYEDDYDAGYADDPDADYQEPAFDDDLEPGDDRRPPPRRPGRSDGFDDWSEPDGMWDERGEMSPSAPRRRERQSRGRPLVTTFLIVLVLAAILAGLWFFRGPLMTVADALLSPGSSENSMQTAPSSGGERTGAQSQSEPARSASTSTDGKLTQRLMPDGTEIDDGPAGTGNQLVNEEGKSTAMLSGEPSMTTQVPEAGAGTNGTAEGLQVGQKMILYEERDGGQGTTGEEGTVVWSVVRESPGDGQPPEPAIQAKVSVPSKGLNALITMKRNGDSSLPASHLVEIVFAFSQNFEGRGIKSVQSPALKAGEQDRGDTLIAVPAKITDTFFMVALNDYVEAADVNLRLLKERNWIDFPFAYENDRRGVMALEKGTTGAEVFDQVIRAWEARQTSDSQ